MVEERRITVLLHGLRMSPAALVQQAAQPPEEGMAGIARVTGRDRAQRKLRLGRGHHALRRRQTAGAQWTTTGTLTQTSTGTCLQMVCGTQTSCFGHLPLTRHRAARSVWSRRPAGRSCTAPCGRTGSSASRRPSPARSSRTGLANHLAVVWQTFLTHVSATVRQVVTELGTPGLADHPAGGHRHLLEQVSVTMRQVVTGTRLTHVCGTIRVTVQGTCLYCALADHPRDRVRHLLGAVRDVLVTVYGSCRYSVLGHILVTQTGTLRITVRGPAIVQTV